MTVGVRVVEACALLPMLHIAAAAKPTVYCTGTHAEICAADICRWPDVSRVYLRDPPLQLRDRRVTVGAAPPASCQLVITSPNEDPSPFLYALAPTGLLCASADIPEQAAALFAGLRQLFRAVMPWREWTPDPLYGALVTPAAGKIARQRHPPAGARRLTAQYLPCLFTFGKDELPLVFPHGRPQPAAEPAPSRTPEFDPR